MTSLAKLARFTLAAAMVAGLSACSPVRWLVVNSDGILTYNRHTGQLELLWEHHSEKADFPARNCPPDSVGRADPSPVIVPVR